MTVGERSSFHKGAFGDLVDTNDRACLSPWDRKLLAFAKGLVQLYE
jgi:hypothetical protein